MANKKKNNNKNSSSTGKTAISKAAAQSKKSSSNKKDQKQSPKEYFRGIKQELKKVVWPTRKELVSDTVVVIAVCTFFAVGFWLVDTGFLAFLRELLDITLS
ncbi:MAG: preprotein translocase subunit SecE [Clostridiales bacterium]|jgi:preprotein translocase subunit SecE|nr:preprotein translocase subunit SecE [Clostridiales bacterium]